MTHIPTIICGCGHEMVREKNGIVLQGNVLRKDGSDPYYKISADRFVCKNCHNSAYLPAQRPLVFQHEEEFEKQKVDAIFHFAT